MNNLKINVALYARFSSTQQRDESIDAQLRAMHKYCEAHSYNIVGEYCDEAKSGTNANREEFQRMMDDSKLDKFDAVIVHKLDRFSRNRNDAFLYKSALKKRGIKLISVLESNIDESPEGKFMEGVIESMNEYTVNNIARETMKGLKENAYNCISTGGIPPLGYDIVDKKYVINEHEAEAVRMIFEMVDNGYGYTKIIKKLNALGYKTKHGNSFGKNSLRDLITNERYKGVYIYNKRSCSKLLPFNRSNRRYHDEEDIIRIPDGCPQIVSKELWERVNKVRTAVNKKSNSTHPYLLSGLVYCDDCGFKFQGNTRNHNNTNKQYTTYRCGGRVNKKICDCKEIRCALLDSWVLDELLNILFIDNNIPIIARILNDNLKSNITNDKEYKLAKENLSKLNKGLNSLIDTVTITGTNDIITGRIKDLKTKITETEAFISQCEMRMKDLIITENDIKRDLKNIRSYMLNPENLEKTRYMLSQYIEKICINNTTVKATFRVAFTLLNGFTGYYTHTSEISRKKLKDEYSGLGVDSWLYRYINALNDSCSPQRIDVLEYAIKHSLCGQRFSALPFDFDCKSIGKEDS